MPGSENGTFFIGELAERTGVSRDTIRYYESAGVIPDAVRSDGGYRLYGPDDVDRISFVGQGQTLGLKLDEIAGILRIVDDGTEPCVHVRQRLSERLDETRDGIRRLRRLERRLEETLSRVAPEPGGPACRCRLIESAGAPGTAAHPPLRGSLGGDTAP